MRNKVFCLSQRIGSWRRLLPRREGATLRIREFGNRVIGAVRPPTHKLVECIVIKLWLQ